MSSRSTAVVLGLCPNGLGVARSLAASGRRVLGFDHVPDQPGFHSRHVEAFRAPDPVRDAEALVTLLLESAGSSSNVPIFPTTDGFVVFLSRHREALASRFDVVLPEAQIVESLLNKRWQYDAAAAAGLDIPGTRVPESPDEAEDIVRQIGLPLIVKPCLTHEWKRHFSVKGFMVDSVAELRECLERIAPTGVEVIAQEVVPGNTGQLYEVCGYVRRDGQPAGVHIKRKLRQFPEEMGLGAHVETVKKPELAQRSMDAMTAIGIKGPAEIEYKLDPRDGRFKLIEINARLTLQNSLARACGVDFPRLQLADLAGEPAAAAVEADCDKTWTWLEIDFEAFRRSTGEQKTSFGSWLKSIVSSDCHAVFSVSDPGPFASFLSGALRRRLRAVTGRS